MPLNSTMHSVQTDLHKYFKTQKQNAKLYGKSKPVATSFDKEGSYLQANQNFENKSASLLKDESTSSAPTENNQKDSTSSTPLRKCELKNVTTKKRKQQQIADREDDYVPLLRDANLEYDHKKEKSINNSAIKRLKLDCESINQEADKEISSTKKLNPEDVKKQLGKCSHISELRSRLLKLNNLNDKLNIQRQKRLTRANKDESNNQAIPSALKTPTKQPPYITPPLKSSEKLNFPNSPCKIPALQPKLQQFKSIDVEVAISPSKSPLKLSSPLKPSSPLKLSQRARFGHLVEFTSGSEVDQLTLPGSFQMIKEDFRAVDTVVSLRHNRQEMTIFSKLKQDIYETIRRTFSELNLGRLKTVFPLAYFFKQEKIISKDSASYNVASYQLTIQPNFNYMETASKNLMEKFNSDSTSGRLNIQFRKMDWAILVERRKIFHNSLLDILKKRHEEFLKKLDPPIFLTKPVRRWHEDFLDSVIELPEAAPLPQSPEDNTPKTAKQVMEQGMNIFSANNRMKAALEAVASSKAVDPVKTTPSLALKNPIVTSALKGLSNSLLEKIRAREKEKAMRDMCRPSKENRELEMLSRLPTLATNMWSIFISVKKATLLWEDMVTHISRCDKNNIPESEIPEHLKLLLNLLKKDIPNWCVLIKIRGEDRLKLMDKERKVSDITNHLNKIIKEKS